MRWPTRGARPDDVVHAFSPRSGRAETAQVGSGRADLDGVTATVAPEELAPPSTPGPSLLVVYGSWSLLASLLLFWVELMVAKMLLPRFGGSASVWNTSLVFFQVTLLAGYAGAHLLARLDSRRHKVVQAALVLVPLLTLPVSRPAFLDSPGTVPAVTVIVALVLMVGAPFFALSTATPTLQTWFAHSAHHRALDPYFLYALSNVGSLVGLLGYPLLVERLLPLRTQTMVWAVGYACFAVLTVVAARMVGSWQAPRVVRSTEGRPSRRRRLRWAMVAFVPSLALLGVTRHLSTDVAAFPLLWTVPLALYLASFVVAFRPEGARSTNASARMVRALAVPAALIAATTTQALWLTISMPLVVLTVGSIAAHGSVYRDRPDPAWVTDFYLWVSLGGALGGLFASLVTPALFDFVVEYPLGIVLFALISGPSLRDGAGRGRLAAVSAATGLLAGYLVPDDGLRVAAFGMAGIVAVAWMDRRWLAAILALILIYPVVNQTASLLASERTFFGVYRVHDRGETHDLASGTTEHGSQRFDDGQGVLDPLAYYHRAGPAGDVMRAAQIGSASLDVGVVGLGVGSLVAYGGTDDVFTFYEIDPVVEELARDPEYFTLLEEAAPEVEVVIGDGRLALEQRRPDHDLLVIDAFSSDAIPVHLLTVEAVASYLDSLSETGRVLLHTSNRHLDLEPVVGRIARELGVSARVRSYVPAEGDTLAAPSTWIVVEPAGMEQLDLGEDWEPAEVSDTLWTDDYSNILSVMVWS